MFKSFTASLPSTKTVGKTLMVVGGALVLVAGGTLIAKRYGIDIKNAVSTASGISSEQVVGG